MKLRSSIEYTRWLEHRKVEECLKIFALVLILFVHNYKINSWLCVIHSLSQNMIGICYLHLQGRRISQARNQRESTWKAEFFRLVSCFADSTTLKMEAKCSSEMSSDFRWTTFRCIPEDRTFHNHSCENLRSFCLYCAIFIGLI
jgi:hypothetical protein